MPTLSVLSLAFPWILVGGSFVVDGAAVPPLTAGGKGHGGGFTKAMTWWMAQNLVQAERQAVQLLSLRRFLA